MGCSGITDHTGKDGALYVQPARLVQMYSIGRTTVWRLLQEMRAMPEFKDSFLDLGWRLKLVKADDFARFMEQRSQKRMYLRK